MIGLITGGPGNKLFYLNAVDPFEMPESSLVIVLGMRLSSDTIGEELLGRMDIGLRVMIEQPAEFIMVSGGYTNPKINISARFSSNLPIVPL